MIILITFFHNYIYAYGRISYYIKGFIILSPLIKILIPKIKLNYLSILPYTKDKETYFLYISAALFSSKTRDSYSIKTIL